MRIEVFDFGVGNLHSLGKALARRGASVEIVRDCATIERAAAIVLPGVGAFAAAAAALDPHRQRITRAIEDGTPCLGICLGMHLLFEGSEEGPGRGLAVLPGQVRRLQAPRVPQMGWNTVEMGRDPVFDGMVDLVAYYANSFVAEPDRESDVIAWTEYAGERFPAAVRSGSTVGVQFHPEKSGTRGLGLIDNFLGSVGC